MGEGLILNNLAHIFYPTRFHKTILILLLSQVYIYMYRTCFKMTCGTLRCAVCLCPGAVFDYLVAHGKLKEKEARSKFRQVKNTVMHNSSYVNICVSVCECVKVLSQGMVVLRILCKEH